MRFAHLSDLHALDLSGVSPWRFLNKRLAGGLNLLRKRASQHPLRLLDRLCEDLRGVPLDHVVVTGDLTNLSLPSEFLRARQALERSGRAPHELSVIPGNHDVYVLEALFGRHFERCMAPYALSDDAQPDALPKFPFLRVRGEIAFIGCNTARPSPVPLADGWLGRRQIQRIEETLASARGRYRVLLIHHPPQPQRMDILRGLRDRKALLAALQRVGCELILHGHEHRDLRYEVAGPEGPIPVIGVGSSTYADPRPKRRARYNIYTVERSAFSEGGSPFRLRIEQRVYDPAADAFLPTPIS